MIAGLQNFANRSFASLLKSSVEEVGSLQLIVFDLICNKDIYMSALVSYHFDLLMNVKHASACPLLQWLYNDDTACQMLSFMYNVSNISKMTFVPASEAILLGSPYSEKIILNIFYRWSRLSLFTFFMTGNLHWKSTIVKWHLLLIVNVSALTDSHDLTCNLYDITLSLGHKAW